MTRLVLSSCLFRYPMGGMMSWLLQYLVGFRELGHEVYYVEKSMGAGDCFDPTSETMVDDCAYGLRAVGDLLARHSFADRWHFVDGTGRASGLTLAQAEAAVASADLFLDVGGDHSWLEHAGRAGLRAMIDCEPGFTQMRMATRLEERGEAPPDYDFYYSTGLNVGTDKADVPLLDKPWHPLLDPVVPGLFTVEPAPPDAPFTTVMTWKSMRPRVYRGRTYGNKDIEFARFESLPSRTRVPLEVAVSGRDVPWERLAEAGWQVRNANHITTSFEAYAAYVRSARGEFSVAKHCYVATNCGWFGDRASVFLASGRPVVMQDTGWSDHLPTGAGLFAVTNIEEATEALDAVQGDYARHARRARELALEHFDARHVLGRFLEGLGIH